MGRRVGLLAVAVAAVATACAPPWLRTPSEDEPAAQVVGCEQAIGPVGPIHFAESGSLVIAGALDLGPPDAYRHELAGSNAVPPESPGGGGDGQDFYKQGIMLRDGGTARIAIAPEARADAALLFGTQHAEGPVLELAACAVGAGEPPGRHGLVGRLRRPPLHVPAARRVGAGERAAAARAPALLRAVRLRRRATRARWAASAPRRRRSGGRGTGRRC